MNNGDKPNIHEETELLNLDKELELSGEALLPNDKNESLAGEGKKRMVPKIICASLAIIIIASIIFYVNFNANSVDLKIAVINTLKASASSEPVALLRSVFTQGSTELILDLESLSDWMYDTMEDGQLSAKCIYNRQNNQMALNFALADTSRTVADAMLHISKNSIVMESDVLFGSTAYGLAWTNFADDLKSSIFNPANGTEFALDDDVYEFLTKLGANGSTSNYIERAKIATMEAIDTLYGSVMKNFKIKKEKDAIQFVDTTSKVTVLSMYGDAKMISTVIKEMLQWIENSQNLKSFMETTAFYYALMEEMELDTKDFVEDFYDNISHILKDFDEIEDMLEEEEAEVNMKFYITRKNRELVKIDFEVSSSSERNRIEITAGPSLKNLELISLTYTYSNDWRDNPERYSLTYEIDENNAETYSANLIMTESSYGENMRSRVFITWDKKDGDFRIKADDLFTIKKGTMLYDKNTLKINIESIELGSEEIKPGLTVILNKKETIPSASPFIDILDMDEDNFEELKGEIYWNLMDFIDENYAGKSLLDFLYYLM